MNVALDSPTDYALEVDFEYPQHVHGALRSTVLSNEKMFGKQEEKLLVILYDKSVTSYIIAICNNVLVTVSALQRSIVYCNSCNLREYIELKF